MIDRQQLLQDIQDGLRTGILSELDLRSFMTTPSPATADAASAGFVSAQVTPSAETQTPKFEKLSAVDAMFYIAGFVFFATMLSIIVQSWEDGSSFVHILLSAGIGGMLWALVYYLVKSPFQNDVRKGLSNAMLLTGSLLLIVGGYIVTNELIGGFEEVNFIPAAFTLAVLGAMHFAFDRMIKKDFTLLLGIVLSVAAFPALLFGILQESDVPADVWGVIVITTMLLLAYATRVVGKINPDRMKIHNSFDSLAAFIVLATMYSLSFSEYGVLWLGVLIASVFGIFYLSIISQNRHLLGNASLFLVITVITISFKYFAGFGATVSLIVATLGLLGSAAIASGINKKYFKQPAPAAAPVPAPVQPSHF